MSSLGYFCTVCGADLLSSNCALTFCRPAVNASICLSCFATVAFGIADDQSRVHLFCFLGYWAKLRYTIGIRIRFVAQRYWPQRKNGFACLSMLRMSRCCEATSKIGG